MRNNNTNLRVSKLSPSIKQRKIERWLSNSSVVFFKFIFWLVLSLMIIIEVEGRTTILADTDLSWPRITEDSTINNINSLSDKKNTTYSVLMQ